MNTRDATVRNLKLFVDVVSCKVANAIVVFVTTNLLLRHHVWALLLVYTKMSNIDDVPLLLLHPTF